MLLVLTLMSLCILSEGRVLDVTPQENTNLKECITHIIKTYFKKYSRITVVHNYGDNDGIIKIVSSIVPIVLKDKCPDMTSVDESYLIAITNTTELNNTFLKLRTNPSWNPNARFLVTIKNAVKDELKEIFDVLLKHHIIDVLVLTGGVDMYTYNPFENYACGRRYDRIIEFEKYPASKRDDLYPYKLKTGLKNCTLRILKSHWPPYTVNPSKNNKTNILKSGLEEIILILLSKMEQFSIEFECYPDDEELPNVNSEMKAAGSLALVQNGEVDGLIGALGLSNLRASAFNYVDTHLPFEDEFRYLVHKAGPTPRWKHMFLVFHKTVWLVFLVSFLTYLTMFIILVKPKDKSLVVFNMVASLTLSSRKLCGSYFTKYLFILWVWFAYIVSTSYTSSLVSLGANPPKEYQISNEKDIEMYNTKPCVSDVINEYLGSVESLVFTNDMGHKCRTFFESIESVSKSRNMFTVITYSLYLFDKRKFYDAFGNPLIYSFKEPVSKIIYAMYFYKGFPMTERLRHQTLRLRENGVIQHFHNHIYWSNNMAYLFSVKERKIHVLVPWSVIISGVIISTIVFFLEIASNKFACPVICKI